MPLNILPNPKSLIVTALPAFKDNYIWLIHDPDDHQKIAVVDPGDAQVVIDAVTTFDWHVMAILVTHHHHDHVGGLSKLKKEYAVPVFGPHMEKIKEVDITLAQGDLVEIENTALKFSIMELPGHTSGHIAYYGHNCVFCGDTLFSAGCGRMFEGSPEEFHKSLTDLAALPEDTAVYCTHEYTASNLRFAMHVEPDNKDIADYFTYVMDKRARNQTTLPSTIALEKKINPFLHCANMGVQKYLATLTGQVLSELEYNPVNTFASMRNLKDNFQS